MNSQPTKDFELISINYPDTGNTVSVNLNSKYAIDRIRFSLGSDLTITNSFQALLVYCDLVSNYIGTIGTAYTYSNGADNYYSDPIQPENGIEYRFQNRFFVSGNYQLSFTRLNRTIPTGVSNTFYLLVEYFKDY